MNKYIVKTHSTFENVYIIEAENEKQALDFLDYSDDDIPDFYQKHLGEIIKNVKLSDQSHSVTINTIREEGYI